MLTKVDRTSGGAHPDLITDPSPSESEPGLCDRAVSITSGLSVSITSKSRKKAFY